jgi:MFS family permease
VNAQQRLARFVRRNLRGLWRLRDFRRLWLSLTVTSFGAQITNLALPLTAALLLHATPLQMGILVALETLPFALVSLHAGVLLDRVRKLPIVIASDVSRGLALLSIPLCAWGGVLSVEVLYAVGFFCGVQNVVGGAAYQVLIAQMAGRERLVEANAKITLGETSSALIGPGIAGALIHALTAPFAIVLDALSFLASALMLRRLSVPNDVPVAEARGSVGAEIREGLALVWNNRTLRSLALVAGAWQVLHHMQIAVLILFATRDLGLSAGALGMAYMAGGLGCVFAATFAERLARRFGVGPLIVYGLLLTAFGWQVFGLTRGTGGTATVALGAGDAACSTSAPCCTASTTCRCARRSRPIGCSGRMTATMRFLRGRGGAARIARRRCACDGHRLRQTLWVVGSLGMVLALVAMRWSPVRRHRQLPAVVLD